MNNMKAKELKEALNAYPDDMEVVITDPLGDYDYYRPDFFLETNENNQLVID